MPLNWLIEAHKWKILTLRYKNISLFESLRSVMIGLSVGIWTPNRLGEIPGRTLIFEKKDRVNAISSATIGSFSQFLVTLIAGIVGLLLFNYFVSTKFQINIRLLVAFSIAIIGIILFLIYFKQIADFAIRKSIFPKLFKKLILVEQFDKATLLKVFFYSSLRYVVFSLQFYLLLRFVGIEISMINSFIATASSYLLLNLSPNILIADIGIRGSVTIFFISFFSQKIDAILLSSILIWLINIVIPSLYGQYELMKFNRQTIALKFDKSQKLFKKKRITLE